MKFAIARWTIDGSFPAFHAMTASTANSGTVWTSASTASARPCDIRNSAASAPQATTKAAPIIAGNVQAADAGDASAADAETAANAPPSRNAFIARGYSMGAVPAIESPSNPLIREIARGLEDRTLLLLEGEKTILDAVSAGLPLEHVLHDASIRSGRLAALSSAQPRLVSRAVLERLAEARTPQHLLAFARRRDVPVARDPRPARARSCSCSASRIRATSARSCASAEAAGRGGRARSARERRLLPSSRGAGQRRQRPPGPGLRRVSFEPFAADAHAAGRTICGAVAEGGENPFEAPLDRTSVLVIGSEGTGLPAGAYRYLDRRLTIPMTAPVDSLNAAVAAALLLYSPSLRASPTEA